MAASPGKREPGVSVSGAGQRRLAESLRNLRGEVSRSWYEAIARTGFSPLTSREVRRLLEDLTDEVIRLLLDEPPERDRARERAREVGGALVDMHYVSPETLSGTQEALARRILEGVAADEAAVLQSRLAVLLSEVAAGFSTRARSRVLEEQEDIRAALLTEQRRVEESLRHNEARLADAQRIAHLGHWDYDPEKDELHWSDEIYRIFGLTRREFSATLEAFQRSVHPEDVGYVEESVRAAFEGRPVVFEHRIVRPGGEVRVVQERAEYVFDPEGRPARLVGTVQDITERKRAEEELGRRARDLAASNAELERFASVVAHDLRGPTRGVNGFARILMEDYAESLDEEGLDYLRRILSSSERMGQLIDGLLDLSRISRSAMTRQEIELGSMARTVAENLMRESPGRDVEFDIAEDLTAEGDPMLLWAVLNNLLANALKFTGREERARIEVGATQQAGETVYHVRDNGVGFDPDHAYKMFGVFQRLHGDEEFEGSGMGLATVQRIIGRHDGRLWAEGRPGRGATIYFTL